MKSTHSVMLSTWQKRTSLAFYRAHKDIWLDWQMPWHCMSLTFPTKSDTNQSVQLQKLYRGLKLRCAVLFYCWTPWSLHIIILQQNRRFAHFFLSLHSLLFVFLSVSNYSFNTGFLPLNGPFFRSFFLSFFKLLIRTQHKVPIYKSENKNFFVYWRC